MKKLLITGFEPFANDTMNASWEIVEYMQPIVGDYHASKLLLPVAFEKASEIVKGVADAISPDLIICLGQHAGIKALAVELVGINLRYSTIPDNNGRHPIDERIKSDGDDAYFATIPVRRIVSAINASDIPAEVSYSAGTYVCNDVFYSLLEHFKGTKTKVGFIHVPYCELQSKEPFMRRSDIVRALRILVNNLD